MVSHHGPVVHQVTASSMKLPWICSACAMLRILSIMQSGRGKTIIKMDIKSVFFYYQCTQQTNTWIGRTTSISIIVFHLVFSRRQNYLIFCRSLMVYPECGISYLIHYLKAAYTDASRAQDCAAVFDSQWLQWQWPSDRLDTGTIARNYSSSF